MATRNLQRLVAERRDEIEQIARARGVTRIRLVGSVARGDDVTTSDIDFLVRFEPGRSLFDQAGLIHDLEQLLGWTSTSCPRAHCLRPTSRSSVTPSTSPTNRPAGRRHDVTATSASMNSPKSPSMRACTPTT